MEESEKKKMTAIFNIFSICCIMKTISVFSNILLNIEKNYLNGQSLFTFLIRWRQGRWSIGMRIGVRDHLDLLLLPLLLVFAMSNLLLVSKGKAQDVES